MTRETWVQSQVESYQRLKKWYLMPPCLTLSIIRYGSRVKWSNPGKGVRPPLHLGVVAIEKGAFWSPSTMVANFTLTFKYEWLPQTLMKAKERPLFFINNDHTTTRVSYGYVLVFFLFFLFFFVFVFLVLLGFLRKFKTKLTIFMVGLFCTSTR